MLIDHKFGHPMTMRLISCNTLTYSEMRKRQWNNGPMMASVTVPSVLSIMILLAASSSVVDAKRGIVQFPEGKNSRIMQ